MATSNLTQPRRSPSQRIIPNFHLVWLDGNFDEKKDDYRSSMKELQQVVNTVNIFVNVDECIDFITSIQEETVFMISSGALDQTTATVIHDSQQVSEMYIFCDNKARHEQWAKEWPKVKGVFTDITPNCEALKQAAQDCDHNAISISFAKAAGGNSRANKDTLNCSFMYTEILKDILLTIDFDDGHIKDFITFSREALAGNAKELKNVDKIQKEYRDHQPIWWYTYNSFLYSMLNKALRLMDVDVIVKMGFFLRDLHNAIQELDSEQRHGHIFSKSFDVFRGQNLSKTDFDQLKDNQNGLLAFNNFLSTSINRDISMRFLNRNMGKTDMVNVLFVIHIDSSIKSTPFGNIKDVSCYKGEEELLFSMHSIFRVGHIKKLIGASEIWEVELILTSDNDPELRVLTQQMQEETQRSTGWFRLGQLLMQLAQYDKAKELYEPLLEQAADQGTKSYLFNQLGWINCSRGNYAEAVEYYGKSLEIMKKTLPENHPDLATSYNNIGSLYNKMGEYSKSLEIRTKTLPENHPDLATSYNNIGSVYDRMGEYSKALEYYGKSLEIIKKTLPENHPDLASSYNNIGSVYDSMGEYSKALEYYGKSLEIRTKTLPENHPDLGSSYNNIAVTYYRITDYKRALNYFQRALDIWTRSLPPDHPSLKNVKQSIEVVKKKL